MENNKQKQKKTYALADTSCYLERELSSIQSLKNRSRKEVKIGLCD